MDLFHCSDFLYTLCLKRLLVLLMSLCFMCILLVMIPFPITSITLWTQKFQRDFLHKFNTKTRFISNETNRNDKFVKNCDLAYKDDGASQDVGQFRNKHFICPVFQQRLGNHLFQYASSYGVAMLNSMSVIVGENDKLTRIFKLDAYIIKHKNICRKTKTLMERWSSAFDNRLIHLNKTENYSLVKWLQSWRYFIHVEDKLRKQFIFKDHILNQSKEIIQTVLRKRGLDRDNVTLVGIHVRRGDKVHMYGRGDRVASKTYIQKAIKHYQSLFNNTFFLVCSNGMDWCKDNIDSKNNIEFIETEKAEVDLSVLASCDHVIQTVGSYSWWAAWLAGGTSVYFKWPTREDSPLRGTFSKDYSDHFYPGWIGMS